MSRHLGGDVTVDGLRRLSGGASRETWSFDATRDGERVALVLRRDPAPTSVGPLDRSTEADVLSAGPRGRRARAVRALRARVRRRARRGLRDGSDRRRDGRTADPARRRVRRRAAPPRPRARRGGGRDPCRADDRAPEAPACSARPSSSTSTGRCSTRSASRTRRSSWGCAASPVTRRRSTRLGSCTATSATGTSWSVPTGCGPSSTGSSPISATRSRTSAGCA